MSHECIQVENITRISAAMEASTAKMSEACDCIKDLTAAIRGRNGTPGLIADYMLVKQDVDEIKEWRKTMRNNTWALWVMVAGTIAAQVIMKAI